MGVSLKPLALTFVIILVASGLLLVPFVSAQSIPKPSAPEFTLKLVQYPYDVAPVTTVEPFTGKTVALQEGYHVENKSVEVTITNPSFDPNAGYGLIFYSVDWKGHFETNWHSFTVRASCCERDTSDSNFPFIDTNAPFTVVTIGLGDNTQTSHTIKDVPADGQIDFRVKTSLGRYERVYTPAPPPLGEGYYDVFKGETSDFSNTQTINLRDDTLNIAIFAIAILLCIIILIAIIVKRKKAAKTL